jgi:F0F1-type ATP synthase membrane subunit b/b'
MTLFTKDYNVDKMIAECKTPYDDMPKHKLRKLLIERDEEINTHIAEIRRLEKSDRLLEMARGKLKKLKAEPDIETLKDRNKWLKEEIKSYERGSETHMVITNNLQQKISDLTKEVNELKAELKAP